MKKSFWLSLLVGISLIFGTSAMAASKPTLPEPVGLTCNADADPVYFDWEDVPGATKYSVDVEFLLEGTWEEGVVVKLSFGTSDRTDGGLMGDSYLDVPRAAFVYDLNQDTIPEQLVGDFRAKVKALNPPGKGVRSQNNPFSDWCYFTLEE